MPTSGRKPHTTYGDVGIMTLTIDGPINSENQGITNENEKQCSMKQNQNLILGRGSEEYVLSLREGTLEASTVNWIIPQPWDREWSFQRGGVFSPTQCEIADCKISLIAETMQRPTDGSAKVSSWGDWSDNNYEFTAQSGTEPTLTVDSTKRYFNSAVGGGTNSLITNFAAVGTDLNVDVSAENFAAVFFVKTPSSFGSNNTLFCFGSINDSGHFVIFANGSGLIKFRTKTGSNNTVTTNITLATDTYYTIIIGTQDSSGNVFVRINGSDDGSTGTMEDIAIDGTGNKLQVNLLVRENATAYSQPWTGALYDFYWLKSSTVDNSFLSEIKKIEGSLAQKYETLGDLPADHDYKTEVPHGSPIKHTPNRFG